MSPIYGQLLDKPQPALYVYIGARDLKAQEASQIKPEHPPTDGRGDPFGIML